MGEVGLDTSLVLTRSEFQGSADFKKLKPKQRGELQKHFNKAAAIEENADDVTLQEYYLYLQSDAGKQAPTEVKKAFYQLFLKDRSPWEKAYHKKLNVKPPSLSCPLLKNPAH